MIITIQERKSEVLKYAVTYKRWKIEEKENVMKEYLAYKIDKRGGKKMKLM